MPFIYSGIQDVRYQPMHQTLGGAPPAAYTCAREEAQANTSGLTTGIIYAVRIYLGVGAYTTLSLAKGATAGSGLSNTFAALYNSTAATKLATSADLSTDLVNIAINSVGSVTLNYTTTAAGYYYLALLIGAGTTPNFQRAPEVHTALYTYAPARAATHATGSQTSMPAALTLSGTNGARLFWMEYK